ASGNILFILTALGSAIFVGYVLKDEAKRELGAGETFTNLWFNYVRFIIPLIILIIFINSNFL
ncbi:MAG: sodium-dependent transporter, partial [Actinobacillus porcinus]|nr:sodium-dependent transporter [Actinobacillus porcinus]